MELDRIIFGDNQFFGINHMSEEKGKAQGKKFDDIREIIRVIDMAYECGIHAFMLNTHDKVAQICDHFRAHPGRYAELKLYPSLPYAHKYANAVNERGMAGAIHHVLLSGSTAKQYVMTVKRGASAMMSRDAVGIMKLLIDAEMKMFRGLNIRVVFLQNIVTDLLFGLGLRHLFQEFSSYIEDKYHAEAGFVTLNLPGLVDFALDCGIENPIVCSGINKIGYLMNSSRASYEQTIMTKSFRPMAMSILASGAVPPSEAVEYVARQKNIRSIVFGASSKTHIVETKCLIENYDRLDRIPSNRVKEKTTMAPDKVQGRTDRRKRR